MDRARLNAASKALLRSDFEQAAVVAFLDALGSSIDADRAYVFEHQVVDGALTTSQRFEWNSGNAAPQIDNPELQHVPMDEVLPRWQASFLRREPVWGLVRDFPAAEREILEPQDIRSILVCPIIADTEVWGFVGFDDCRRERTWSREERDLLAGASSALAAALRHQTVRQRLAVARAALRETVGRLGADTDG
ncbi:MAG: GAF domain-containing protein [Nannocystaceae bacterium]|nr:GAF domain-containing protein [bacterium]